PALLVVVGPLARGGTAGHRPLLEGLRRAGGAVRDPVLGAGRPPGRRPRGGRPDLGPGVPHGAVRRVRHPRRRGRRPGGRHRGPLDLGLRGLRAHERPGRQRPRRRLGGPPRRPHRPLSGRPTRSRTPAQPPLDGGPRTGWAGARPAGTAVATAQATAAPSSSSRSLAPSPMARTRPGSRPCSAQKASTPLHLLISGGRTWMVAPP